jgi:Cse1
MWCAGCGILINVIIRHLQLVNAMILFLTSVARSVHHALFSGEEILKEICTRVVIPNMKLRESDIETFEDNPAEYIRHGEREEKQEEGGREGGGEEEGREKEGEGRGGGRGGGRGRREGEGRVRERRRESEGEGEGEEGKTGER